MELPFEIRCEHCGRLYATIAPNGDNGWLLHVEPPGLPLRLVSIPERLGQLMCDCGHRTPVDLVSFGVA